MADPPKGTLVAAYYRCSTDGQEHSIEGQKNVVRKEIERKGWVLTAEYEDEGKSGAATDDRLGLQRLLNDAGSEQFQLVSVYDVSRITRSGPGKFWALMDRVNECGKQVYCCARQQCVADQSALLFTVDAMQAREENIKRSRDATRGTNQSIFLRDQDPGRRPPFGFDQMRVDVATGKEVERIRFQRDGSKQIMNPEGSTVIRVIPKGEEYRKGASLRTVLVPGDPQDVETLQYIFRNAALLGLRRLANDLNLEGLTSPTGQKWSASSLRDILQNKAYIGSRVCNRVSKSRYHYHGKDGVVARGEADAGKLRLIKRPESDWNEWENKHTALVDEASFREVQEAREQRQGDKTWNRKGRNQDREYLLSAGFITCQRCGAGLNGTTVTSKGYAYPKYYCSSNRRHGSSACAGYSVHMDNLDAFVLDEVREHLSTPDCLAALAEGLEEEFMRHLQTHKPLGSNEIEVLKNEQQNIERARQQITDTIKGNPAAITLMAPEIEKLAAEAESVKRKLKQAKPRVDKAQIKQMVERGIEFFQERVLGPLEAAAATTENVGTIGATTAADKGKAVAKYPQNRPCIPELRGMLRLIGVKLTYNPDRKEGDLTFSPF